MIGEKFNRLFVISISGKRLYNKIYLCKCDCGKEVNVEGNKIKSGHTKSCGCLQKEIMSSIKTKHGLLKGGKNNKIFSMWQNMKNRCLNKNVPAYKNYGGRGICICEEWLDSSNFIDWVLSNGWKENLQIDRIDNNKGYSPDNCRFVNRSQNILNSRKSIGSVAGVCRDMCVDYKLVKDRLRNGWSFEESISTPKRKRKNESCL